MSGDLGAALAATVLQARQDKALTVAALAQASGVSRAMVSKVERGEVQPTAALLAKLSAALGMTLSELVARAEDDSVRLVRRDEQPVWADPETGYVRRAVSPPASAAVELVEVDLPAGASVSYPAESYRYLEQQVWVLAGALEFREGDQVHGLTEGDCLQLGPPAECAFTNRGAQPCRYLVVINKVSQARRA